jgi:hypothetical protein
MYGEQFEHFLISIYARTDNKNNVLKPQFTDFLYLEVRSIRGETLNTIKARAWGKI